MSALATTVFKKQPSVLVSSDFWITINLPWFKSTEVCVMSWHISDIITMCGVAGVRPAAAEHEPAVPEGAAELEPAEHRGADRAQGVLAARLQQEPEEVQHPALGWDTVSGDLIFLAYLTSKHNFSAGLGTIATTLAALVINVYWNTTPSYLKDIKYSTVTPKTLNLGAESKEVSFIHFPFLEWKHFLLNRHQELLRRSLKLQRKQQKLLKKLKRLWKKH